MFMSIQQQLNAFLTYCASGCTEKHITHIATDQAIEPR